MNKAQQGLSEWIKLVEEFHKKTLQFTGKPNTNNLGSEFAEHLSAELLSNLNNSTYEVAKASTKGFDISNGLHKVEVKSVFGKHRNIYNLKDKAESNQVLVIWFNTDSFVKVDRVVLYDTALVMESVKENGGARKLFTRKSQNEMKANNIGLDLTVEFQTILDFYAK